MNMKRVGIILLALSGIVWLTGCASSGGTKYNSPSEWVQQSKTGPYLGLAEKADVWSDPKPFSARTGQLTVQSKFVRQLGTTCEYHVQFNNVGSSKIDESVQLNGADKAAFTSNDGLTRVQLNPGASVAYGMEMRECPLQWGESKDMAKCASCQPILFFLKR